MYKQIKLFFREKLDDIITAQQMVKINNGIANELSEETDLTKKEAKKVVSDAMDAYESTCDNLINSKLPNNAIHIGVLAHNMIMVSAIRSNASYNDEVYEYCDLSVMSFYGVSNDKRNIGTDIITNEQKKTLDVMLDRYMSIYESYVLASKELNKNVR